MTQQDANGGGSVDDELRDRFAAELEKAGAADRDAALMSTDSLMAWVAKTLPGMVPLLDQLVVSGPALLQALLNLFR
jgi:hypothetical protein